MTIYVLFFLRVLILRDVRIPNMALMTTDVQTTIQEETLKTSL